MCPDLGRTTRREERLDKLDTMATSYGRFESDRNGANQHERERSGTSNFSSRVERALAIFRTRVEYFRTEVQGDV